MKNILFTITLLFILQSGFAQKLYFNNPNYDMGGQRGISQVIQDLYGFIWIVGMEGLFRYDGNEIYKIESFSSPVLNFNDYSLLLGENDLLWIGTTQGLFSINVKTLEFQKIELGNYNLVQCLYMGNDSAIWVGMKNGLIRLNPETFEYEVFNKEKNKLSNNTVRAVYQDANQTLWVGTENKLNYLAKGANEFSYIDLKGDYKPLLSNNLILDIKPCSPKTDTLLWIGTETGLCLFNSNNGNKTFYRESNAGLSNEVVKSIYCSQDGELWLGTDNGLNIFHKKSESSISYHHNALNSTSIINDVVWNIFEDDAGVIWLSTSNGISKVIPEQGQFDFYMLKKSSEAQPGGVQAYDVISDDDINYWLATNEGVFRYNSTNDKQSVFSTESELTERILINKVNTMHKDRFDRLWIGTVGGVNVWDAKNKLMKSISENDGGNEALQRGYTSRFVEAADGSFWISYWGKGLYKVKGEFKNLESLEFSKFADFNTNLIVSGEKALWAVDNNKLHKIDLQSGEIHSVDAVNQHADNFNFTSLYFSENGTVWLGTQNAILAYNLEKDNTTIHILEGSKTSSIASLIEDNSGNIWGSTYNNIVKLNRITKTIETFNLTDIIPTGGFLPNSVNRAQNGNLAFGCNNGFVRFSPDDIRTNNYSPNVVISGLKLDGKNIVPGEVLYKNKKLDNLISFTDEIQLDYKNNSFTLEFSSLHYGKKSGNTYSYKLEGFDSEWRTTSSDRYFVSYSNLRPKSYTFRLKGTNNEGVWQEKEATITIRILPPLWLRWYFILAMVVLVIAITITILYFFLQKRKLAREVQMEQAEKRNIAALNRAKLEFFTNISHEFRTPLSLIVGPINKLNSKNEITGESREMVTLIHKNASRMLRLVNQLMDFRKISSSVASLSKSENNLVQLSQDTFELFIENAKEKGIQFQFWSGYKKFSFDFDKSKIETVLFNLLSNAFKFTTEGEISLKLAYSLKENNEGVVKILVSDTGKGIPKEQLEHIFDRFFRAGEQEQTETGTGIGLNIVKEFIELHNGEIIVKSTLGKGTTIEILLPTKENETKSTAGIIEYNIETQSTVFEKKDEIQNEGIEADKKTILIVEDNIEMAGFIAGCLKSDYKVFIENNGADGVRKATKLLPDLIISDIVMPLKRGTELSNELKSNILTSHIPIILLTALNATENKKEGYFTGADDYITKPFDEELLLARIAGLLKNREVMQQNFQLQKSIDPAKLGIGNPDQDFLKKLMQIIEKNIHERDLNTTLLTKELGMSHSVVYKKLKALTGQSIIDFIRDFKLKRAAQLISEHGFSVTDACYKVGFSDRRYFTNVFKQKFGKSPSEYKKALG